MSNGHDEQNLKRLFEVGPLEVGVEEVGVEEIGPLEVGPDLPPVN